MAREFPDASILGIDRPQVKPLWKDEVPVNCKFEAHSVDDDLHELVGKFDLIHMRFAAGGFKNIVWTLHNLQKCLRPGGIFILIDATGNILAEDGVSELREKSSRHPEGSRLRRMLFGMFPWPDPDAMIDI
jgi:hypothetical protein